MLAAGHPELQIVEKGYYNSWCKESTTDRERLETQFHKFFPHGLPHTEGITVEDVPLGDPRGMEAGSKKAVATYDLPKLHVIGQYAGKVLLSGEYKGSTRNIAAAIAKQSYAFDIDCDICVPAPNNEWFVFDSLRWY